MTNIHPILLTQTGTAPTTGQVLTASSTTAASWAAVPSPTITAAPGNFSIAGDLTINSAASPTQQVQIFPNQVVGSISGPYTTSVHYEQCIAGGVFQGTPVSVYLPMQPYQSAVFQVTLQTSDPLGFTGDSIIAAASFYMNSINLCVQRGTTTTFFNQGSGQTTLTIAAAGSGPNAADVVFTITNSNVSYGKYYTLWLEWTVANQNT